MKNDKNLIKRIYFKSNNKVKRNTFVFDAGLHTLNLVPNEGEKDHEFVTRYLLQYFKGCENRGGTKNRKYLLTVNQDDKFCVVWNVMDK